VADASNIRSLMPTHMPAKEFVDSKFPNHVPHSRYNTVPYSTILSTPFRLRLKNTTPQEPFHGQQQQQQQQPRQHHQHHQHHQQKSSDAVVDQHPTAAPSPRKNNVLVDQPPAAAGAPSADLGHASTGINTTQLRAVTETHAVGPPEQLSGSMAGPVPEWVLQPIPLEMPRPTQLHAGAETPAVDPPAPFSGPPPEPMPDWMLQPIPLEMPQPSQPHAETRTPVVDLTEPLGGSMPAPIPEWMLQPIPQDKHESTRTHAETENSPVDPPAPLCGPLPKPIPDWMLQPVPQEMPQPAKMKMGMKGFSSGSGHDEAHQRMYQYAGGAILGMEVLLAA